jgi:hypothetical protein
MADLLINGRDTYCLDALVPGRMATGLELVGQRLYHRISTPAGSLRGGEDEANFCEDLAAYVGSIEDAAVGPLLPARCENILLRDPAVISVDVVATRSAAAGQVSWGLTIAVSTTLGPVTLIVNVSAVSVDLLGVR